MPSFDLLAWHESVACNGLDYKRVAAGELAYSVVNGNDGLQTKGDGYIPMAWAMSAAIANFASWRLGRQRDNPLRRHMDYTHSRDQTGALGDDRIARLHLSFASDDVLLAEVDNGNNAQVDGVYAILVPAGVQKHFSLDPPVNLPKDCVWTRGVGATTNVANTWTDCAITWQYAFERGKKYICYGIYEYQATGYAFRFIIPSGPDERYKPGFMAGDTCLLAPTLYSEQGLFEFEGKNPPNIQSLASAADTAQYVGMLIKEV